MDKNTVVTIAPPSSALQEQQQQQQQQQQPQAQAQVTTGTTTIYSAAASGSEIVPPPAHAMAPAQLARLKIADGDDNTVAGAGAGASGAAVADDDGGSLSGNSKSGSPKGIASALDVRIDVKGAYIVDDNFEREREREQHNSNDTNDHNGLSRSIWKQRFNNGAAGPTSKGEQGAGENAVMNSHVGASDEEEEVDEDEDVQRDSRDIRLPHQRSIVSHMAIDIGGSLIKVCYWSFEHGSQDTGGRLSFRKFPTDRIDSCIEFMRQLAIKHRMRRLSGDRSNGNSQSDINDENASPVKEDDQSAVADDDGRLYVVATGGGAYKYHDKITEALGVEVMREDEMECLIIGLDFFISQIPSEVYTFGDARDTHQFVPAGSFKHPYILVNIGSGVSIVKVSGPREFTRVGGTSLGGGTLWGLLSLLTGARNFEDMLHMAERGDNTAVDMLVGDIYGSDYGKIGLKSTTIASSFGKVYRMKRQAERDAEDNGGMSNNNENGQDSHATNGDVDGERPGYASKDSGASGSNRGDAAANHISFRPEDVSKSLLYAVSNNIGQIAYLHAQRHNCEHIYFGGSFIGGHWQTMATLSYAIKFWSGGSKQAYFLRHEGYLGAVGAFLRRQPVHWGARRGSVEGLFPLSSGSMRPNLKPER